MKKYIGKRIKKDIPELDSLQKELKRERYKRRFRRLLRSTVNALIVVAAVAALIATLVLPVLQIAGTSMEPSLEDGNIVVLAKTNHLETEDLCAFYYSNKILIKRVIATPGDYLWIEPDGTVFVNGVELIEPYLEKKALGECDVEFPCQIPENALENTSGWASCSRLYMHRLEATISTRMMNTEESSCWRLLRMTSAMMLRES